MRIAVAAFAVALAGPLAGPVAARAQGGMDMINGASAVKWAPAPEALPKGAEIAVLSGDPSKDGPYVLRLRLPANYQIPPHHHPTTENVTVLSGSFHAGMGDRVERAKARRFSAGGFAALPAQMNHYAWASTATVIQVHGQGPFEIVYVNPADDPRHAQ
jgi:quercetin dioxygenase-like cupin family protein